MNVLKPHKKNTIITLLERSCSQHKINRITGIDRKTIRRYEQLHQAGVPDLISNSPIVATGSPQDGIQTPPPRPPDGSAAKSTDFKIPQHARSSCEPFREWIEEQVRLKRNATAIYQELVDRHFFEAKYNSVKRFVRGLKRIDPEQFDRLDFLPGEEAQVDYGEGALTLDPKTGKYRRPRLFVMTLRYSRRSFRKVVWKSSKEVWCRLHEEAFRYFGGCPEYIVLDNLKEGVIKPDIYEPELNRLYEAMLLHYTVIADPARVRDPNRKGTVENAIQHTQGTALKAKRFESIDEQNQFLMQWEEKWAAQRIHGRTKRQVEAMFQEEKPHLKALPISSFRYFEDGERTVGDDTTIQVGHSSYAARPAPIGSIVLVRIYDLEIEIRDLKTQTLLRTHPRSCRKGTLLLPDDERPFNPSRQTHTLMDKARAIGPKTLELCEKLFELQGRPAQKSMWGIMGIAGKYPASVVEGACNKALELNIRSSKEVRFIAEKLFDEAVKRIEKTEGLTTLESQNQLTQLHPLIRPNQEYVDLFSQSARETSGQTNPEKENEDDNVDARNREVSQTTETLGSEGDTRNTSDSIASVQPIIHGNVVTDFTGRDGSETVETDRTPLRVVGAE